MRKDSRLRTTYVILFVLVTLLSSAGIYLLKYPPKTVVTKKSVVQSRPVASATQPTQQRKQPVAPPPQPAVEPSVEPAKNPMMSAMLPAQAEPLKVVEAKSVRNIETKKAPRKLANVESAAANPVAVEEKTASPQVPVVETVPAEPAVAAEPPVKQVVKLEAVIPPEKKHISLQQSQPKVGAKFFLGAGLNYFRYQENLSDVNTNYNGTRGPSYLVGANFSVTDRTHIMASYKSTPIYFDNASVGFSRLQSSWNTLELQGSTKLNSLSNSRREINLLYGLQFHEMPLALFRNIDNQPALRTLSSANASLGASNVCYLNPWTRTSVFGRLQYPVSSESVSGSSINVKPQLLFDGSLGIEKNVSSLMWLGLHWYGQYQKIKFKYSDAAIAAEGQQSAVFSTLELRLNLDY